MSDVKRFCFDLDGPDRDCNCSMMQHPLGDFVRYADFSQLRRDHTELVAALTKSEQPGGCIISRTAPIAHCCKNCDALLLLARLAMKESKT